MKKIFFIATICLTTLSMNSSCISVTSQDTVNQNLNKKLVEVKNSNDNTSASVDDVNSLCNKLHELKRIPFEEEITGDSVYDGLLGKGQEAVPCLVEKITDTTLMKDPRDAPHIRSFKVGDAAVFLLHRITKEPLEKILPDDVAKRWKTEGVYSYFSYVEDSKNRKKIQTWWKDWMVKNLNK